MSLRSDRQEVWGLMIQDVPYLKKVCYRWLTRKGEKELRAEMIQQIGMNYSHKSNGRRRSEEDKCLCICDDVHVKTLPLKVDSVGYCMI